MLRELQLGMANAIAVGAPLAAGHFAGSEERRELGLRVYRNNAAHARVSALRDTYPAVLALVGDDCFATLALDMAERRPVADARPESWAMRLPDFLAETPLDAEVPYLADIARIEAAILAAASANDPVPPPPALLADPDWAHGAQLHLAASAGVVRSRFPAFAIWQAEAPADGAGDCIVHRDGLSVDVLPLTRALADRLCELNDRVAAAAWLESVGEVDAATIGLLIARGAIIIDKQEGLN